jgi:hypothetical protein
MACNEIILTRKREPDMPKAGIREIRAYLAQKSSDALIDEIILLVKNFKGVNEYYQFKLSSEGDSEALEKYKEIIRNEFFPKRGLGKLRLSNIRKAFSDYKKVSSSTEGRLELMLSFIENGAQFIQDFGDIDERFYEIMENTYEEACKLVSDLGLKTEWIHRFQNLVEETDDTGYGFGDTIRQTFNEFFRK